jgi:hypothetical protein
MVQWSSIQHDLFIDFLKLLTSDSNSFDTH